MSRILLTCRDRGAFEQIMAIAAALEAGGHTVRVVVSATSPSINQPTVNLDPTQPTFELMFDGPWQSLADVPVAVHLRVSQIFDEFNPDVLVVGLAHRTEVAVDELFLVTASGKIPTIVMQDFWGELKQVGNCEPDHYLVLDRVAARNTATHSQIHVVGSPKHAAYGQLDRLQLRQAFRDKMSFDPEQRIIGYFGQNLHNVPSYRPLVAEVAEAVAKNDKVDGLIYRPHPRENAQDINATQDILAQSGKFFIADPEPRIENWLLAVDVVLSCFSTCGYDMLQMNRLDTQPWASVVYLDHVSGITANWKRDSGLDELPPVFHGAALASSQSSLSGIIAQALDPLVRLRLQKATIAAIPDPWDAPKYAAEIICSIAASGLHPPLSASEGTPTSTIHPVTMGAKT